MSTREAAETARLRAEIEQTRAEMSTTIDAIQEKLNPQHIADQVRHTVHEQIEGAKASVRDATIGKAEALMRDAGDSVNDARYTTVETIRHNPIPAAMVAIGLGWLFMNRSNSRRERHSGGYAFGGDQYQYRGDPYRGEMYYNANHPAYRGDAVAMYGTGQRRDEGMLAQGQRRAGEAVGHAQHAVGGAVNQAQQTVSGAAQQAASTVGGAVNQAASTVGGAAQQAASTVGGAVNQAASTVGGAAQQAASTVGGAAQQAASTVGGAVNQAASTVGGAAQQAASTVGDAAQRAQETAGQLAGRTVYVAGRVEDRFERLLWENPLAVGAMALAMGAAAGFALPPTERENKLMGEARENLFQQAQEVAQDTVSKVQQVATEVVKEVEQTTVDKSREVGLTGTP